MNGISIKTAQLVLNLYNYFELYPKETVYVDPNTKRVYLKEDVEDFIIEIVRDIPGYEKITKNDINQAKYVLSKIIRGEIEDTLPPDLDKKLENFEERRIQKQKIREGAAQRLQDEIERQKKLFERKEEQNLKQEAERAKFQAEQTTLSTAKNYSTQIDEANPKIPTEVYKSEETLSPKAVDKDTFVYLTPNQKTEPVLLSPQDAKNLIDDASKAIENPTAFSDGVRTLLQNNPDVINKFAGNPKGLELATEYASKDYTQTLINIAPQLEGKGENLAITPPPNKTWMFASVSNLEDSTLKQIVPDDNSRKTIAEANQGLAILEENKILIVKNILSSSIKPEILNVLYPDPGQVTYQLSSVPSENSFGINLYQAQFNYNQLKRESGDQEKSSIPKFDTNDIKNAFNWYKNFTGQPAVATVSTGTVGIEGFAAIRNVGTVANFFETAGFPYLVNPATAGYLNSFEAAIGSNWVQIPNSLSFGLQSIAAPAAEAGTAMSTAPLVTGTTSASLAATATTEAAVTTATAATATTAAAGGTAAATGLLASISAALPVIGAIIAAGAVLIQKLLPKVFDFVVKHSDKFFSAALAFIAYGAISGQSAFVVGGFGIGAGAALLTKASPISALKIGANGIIGGLTKAFTKFVFPDFGISILITLIATPIIVAILMFIINSGAYIVPPGGSSYSPPGSIESPYIAITKTASPSGPLSNSDLPQTIKYTVNIRAKKGTLTNISFTNTCSIINRSGNKPNCSPPIPDPIPTEINEYTFNYEMPLNKSGNEPGFEDAFVTDTFQIKADSPEKAGAIAAASATIKIGTPPENCPQEMWPIGPNITESGLSVTQGPDGGYSHLGYEATDVGATADHVVKATHSGIVTIPEENSSGYGKYMLVTSSCGGKTFYSLYAHLSAITVQAGAQVLPGQEIGRSGNTGHSSGAHLHYEFRNSSGRAGPGSDNPPIMAQPYVPTAVPRGCVGRESCNITIQ